MTLTDSEKKAVANFSQNFEAACVGLQMNNPDVPTISPEQYALCLGAAIYAAQVMLTNGDLLPSEDSQSNFSSFLNACGTHYANTIVSVATSRAEEILEQAGEESEPG